MQGCMAKFSMLSTWLYLKLHAKPFGCGIVKQDEGIKWCKHYHHLFVFHRWTKHIDVAHHFIHEIQQDDKIKVAYIQTKQ
jgi:hypothetical protein